MILEKWMSSFFLFHFFMMDMNVKIYILEVERNAMKAAEYEADHVCDFQIIHGIWEMLV